MHWRHASTPRNHSAHLEQPDCKALQPFRPGHNDTFQVMTFASRGGTTFDTHEGLDLGSRLALVPTYGTTDLVLTAVQGGRGGVGRGLGRSRRRCRQGSG